MNKNNNRTTLLFNRLRLRHVSLLLAVNECGSLNKASSQIGLSQPAATKMLMELEDCLGVKLYERNRTGLSLTAEGQAAVQSFFDLRRVMSQLGVKLSDLSQGRGQRLSIGCTELALNSNFFDVIPSLKRIAPYLDIEILVEETASLRKMLNCGEISLVFDYIDEQVSNEFSYQMLFEDSLCLCIEPDLSRKQSELSAASGVYSFDELVKRTWILPVRGSIIRKAVEHELLFQGKALQHGVFEIDSMYLSLDVFRKFKTLLVLPNSQAMHLESLGVLMRLDYKFRTPPLHLGLMHKSTRPLCVGANLILDHFSKKI